MILTLGRGVVVHAASTNEASRALSLQECIRIALEHNLDVKVARFEPEIARHNVSAAYGVYEPTFEIAGTHSYNASPGGIDEQNRPFPGTTTEGDAYRAGITGFLPTGLTVDLGADLAGREGLGPSGPFENADASASIQMRQPLLKNFWIDSARLTIQVNKKQLQISEQTLRGQIMNVLTAVQLAYYDLLLARERIKVQEQALQLAERLVKETKRRVGVGTVARLDEKQAESQVSARQSEVYGAQGAFTAQEYQLKNLLSDNFQQWDGIRIQPTEALSVVTNDFDLHQSWARGLAQRPDLIQLKLDLERQGFVLKYQRNQIFPQLDLVGSYGQVGANRDYSGALEGVRKRDSPSYTLGAVLSIPVGGNRSARANYRASKAEMNQSLVRLKQLEQAIMVEIGIALEQARTRFAQVDATRQSRVFAKIALEAEEKKLDNGRTTSFVVLQLQRELTTAQLAELAALAEYNKALAQLALREGSALERTRLNLEVR
ncbi:MAG: TolC family protein [Verrucomicrobiales bacterium]|nr:TolC family protein [Verrucomicrobiales bacterium]